MSHIPEGLSPESDHIIDLTFSEPQVRLPSKPEEFGGPWIPQDEATEATTAANATEPTPHATEHGSAVTAEQPAEKQRRTGYLSRVIESAMLAGATRPGKSDALPHVLEHIEENNKKSA